MKIFAFTGTSDTGKTQLIQKLIGELKSRGNSVSVIKHCAHGFDLEAEGKDSAQFIEAGSDLVCMYSSEGLAVLQKKMPDLDVNKITREYLKCGDFILVEGGRSDKTLKKIEVMRKGVSEKIECSPEELIAIISDFDAGKDIPVFHPEETNKIADFLENQPHEKGPQVYLDIDDANVPMNPFVQKIITNTVMGMIDTLEGIPEKPECITLTLMRKWEKDEKI
jgi:molybdopterin-guanine dinucleotide biosynthesis protein B